MRAAFRCRSILAVLLALVNLTGCQPVDDPGDHLRSQQLYNDLGVPAVVTACDASDCHRLVDSDRTHLRPGGWVAVNVDGDGGSSPYVVEAAGRPTRCLDAGVNAQGRPARMPLSLAAPCPQHTGKDVLDIFQIAVDIVLPIGLVVALVGGFSPLVRKGYRRIRQSEPL